MATITPEQLQSIYEDVALLQSQVAELQAQMATAQSSLMTAQTDISNLQPTDTGWNNLTLNEGVLAYNENGTPQYRKIGNKVYIRGAVKNILERDTVIGVLPESFRPLHGAHSYVQNTSMSNNSANFSRLAIRTDGSIVIEGVSAGGSFGENKYFPIHTEYLVD